MTATCEHCLHPAWQHEHGPCWGRLAFNDAYGGGALCGCDSFAEEPYDDEGCCDDDCACWDDEGQEECTGCGDHAGHLSSDGLCDGCVVHGVPRAVITLQPQPGYL